MSPWKARLGLVGLLAVTGRVAGEPPVSPLIEGREPNPVVRDLYQTEEPVGCYVAPPEGDRGPVTGAQATFPALVWEVLLDQLTFPLGTAAMTGSVEVGGV